MDDIRVVAPDKKTAKRTLGHLIKTLREIGLDVNSLKTKILDREKVKEFRDPLADEIDLVSKLVRSGKQRDIWRALPLMMKIFEAALDKERNSLYRRHLGFSINRFILLKNYLKNNRRLINNSI